MKYGKIAVSALFTASLLTCGVVDPVLDTTPVARAFSANYECELMSYLQAISRGQVDYSISSLEFGTAYPGSVDESIYVNTILNGASIHRVKGWELPEGQYVTLSFPDEGTRYDFFLGKDGNYFRQVTGDGGETAFHADYDENVNTSRLVNDWCQELLTTHGNRPVEGAVRWIERNAGRATMTTSKLGGEVYKVEVVWPNGAAEKLIWRFTAMPSGPNMYTYDDGECIVRRYRSDGSYSERTRSSDASGSIAMDGEDILIWEDFSDYSPGRAYFDRE